MDAASKLLHEVRKQFVESTSTKVNSPQYDTNCGSGVAVIVPVFHVEPCLHLE